MSLAAHLRCNAPRPQRAPRAIYIATSAAVALVFPACDRSPSKPTTPNLPPSPRPAWNDSEASTRVQMIRAAHPDGRRFLPADVDFLKEVVERNPEFADARQLLMQAYQERRDWHGMVALMQETPEAMRSPGHELQLAKLLITATRLHEADDVLKGMHAEQSADMEVQWLRAYLAYTFGENAQASQIFDAHWSGLLAGSHARDVIVMRGLLYFRENQLDRAIELFERAPKSMESVAHFNSAFGRVLVAAGQTQRAQPYLDRAEQLLDTEGGERKRKGRLSAMSRRLNDALNAHNHATSEQVIHDMLPLADPPLKAQLYNKLSDVYQATGKSKLAAEAKSQAAQFAAATGK